MTTWFLCLTLATIGTVLLCYPQISRYLGEKRQHEAVEEFRQRKNTTGKSLLEDGEDYSDLLNAMRQYNEELYLNGQKFLSGSFACADAEFDLTAYGLSQDEAVGVVEIPAADILLPVYLGVSEGKLMKGAGVLSTTSLPIGGENTCCVIAAHRGYKGIPLFREIERIKEGDTVYITNMWETLTYRVFSTVIVRPDETDRLLIQKGQDRLMLVTCHPYRVNTQRYVIFCERTK